MILEPREIKVSVWPNVGWRIQWSLEQKDVPPATYDISIDRASSPEGPWTEAASEISLATVTHEDRLIPSFRAFWEYLYYRIRIVEIGVGDFFVSEPISVYDRADRVASEIIRQHELLLYGVNAHPGFYARDFACFKRTKFGIHCTFCSDPHTGERIIPRCEICQGTGYIEGYANPIKFRARFINSPTKADFVNVTGEDEVDVRTIFMAAYPILEPGDVLVQKSRGERWFVESIQPSEPGGILVSQRASVSRIRTESVHNSLIYPGDT